MANILQATIRAYMHNQCTPKRYVRIPEMTELLKGKYANLYTYDTEVTDGNLYAPDELTRLLAVAAGALYKFPRIEVIHKERLEDYMKHLYRVPESNKQVIKKFVRIGEGSIIYSIGRHRFIEMARAAGATYKINEGTGGTVLINLEVFDEYMEQFRQMPVPMKHPLFSSEGDDW